ncbi:hypothetical protein M8845_18820 [Gelidibacter japonicus]|uniref:hypothetical protein n=1 Tax=Gelidibacter japonicus TaxID=1962232 RepID=UPI002020D469|nr:hypothetical protein [Gelidibacter japonicus]MCL8009481.1 hypothetical protein [Gelidibacter japonicus]
MNAKLAKLKALRKRVINVQELHNTPPEDIFDNLRDEFLKLAEQLKTENEELEDFKPQNYNQFRAGHGSYYKWATRALIGDIEYFIDFLTDISTIQIPNLEVSEEGIYFAGQHFDALLKFNKIIAKASKEILLVDNYLNENILELLGNKNPDVKCRVLTLGRSMNNTLKTFVETFNKQHNNLEVKTTSVFHDRFVIIDKSDFYHFGASIKDAGNKGFMFSKIEQDFIKDSLIEQFENEWNK